MTARRGRCPVCRHACRLRKDGTLGAHHPGGGPDCRGTGGAPEPYDPNLCAECAAYRYMTPGLVEACWSVGIERGKDGDTLLWEVLEAYHGNGHQEGERQAADELTALTEELGLYGEISRESPES